VSLVIPAESLPDFARRLPGHKTLPASYRLITIDVELEPNLVGFMAHISRALAAAGIPLMPLAAFSRDHLLVPSDKFDLTLKVLEKLRSGK
jgi:hypothetical protein